MSALYKKFLARATVCAAVCAVAAICVADLGCARRQILNRAEPERLERLDGGLPAVLVFPSRKLRSYYPQQQDNEKWEVNGKVVRVRGAFRPHIRILGRRAAGKVVAEDALNGMRRLYVSFEDECKVAACAHAFVQTEHDRYSLVTVPDYKPEYRPAISYRRNRLRRNQLRLTKTRSLAEINEVLAAVRRSNRALTIDLQILKDRWRPTLRTRERIGGVSTPEKPAKK